MSAADDRKALDVVYLGQVFADLDGAHSGDDTTLDVVFLAEPIGTTGTGSLTTDSTATTSQAQSASVAGFIGPPAPLDATVTTSQGQHVAAIQPLDVAIATSQGQHGAASAQAASAVAGSTSQAQGSNAAATTATPWALVRRDLLDVTYGPSGVDGFSDALPAAEVIAGNHILLAVQHDMAATASVTDTAGNTYVATSEVGLSTGTAHLRWFYCLNALGHSANVITVSWDADVSGGGRVLTALHVQSPGPAAFDHLAQNVTNTASTSISAGPFNTAGPGFIAAAVVSVSYDTEATWTNGMAFTTPRSTYFYGTGTRITSAAQSATSVGITGTTVSSRRLLSAVSIVEGVPGASVGTRQGQTSSAAAAASFGTSTVSATTSQAQHSAASAATSAAGQAATSQAQQAAASATLSASSAASSAQAQTGSAQAGVASDTGASTAQAQASSADAGVSLDTSAQLAQAQAASGQLDSVVEAFASTASAQQASGALASAYVLDVATYQGQSSEAQAGVSADAQATTAQGQGSAAVAGIAADTSAATDQKQRVHAQVRAESVNTTESGQVQHVAGVLGLSSDAPSATRQGQHADLLAGVASDLQVESGQAQHIGDGNRLAVGVDAVVTTAQERQHTKGVLAQFLPQPGTLTAGARRLHPELSGTVQARPALAAPNRMRASLSGRIDLRPDR